jgi:hypothetical protein
MECVADAPTDSGKSGAASFCGEATKTDKTRGQEVNQRLRNPDPEPELGLTGRRESSLLSGFKKNWPFLKWGTPGAIHRLSALKEEGNEKEGSVCTLKGPEDHAVQKTEKSHQTLKNATDDQMRRVN